MAKIDLVNVHKEFHNTADYLGGTISRILFPGDRNASRGDGPLSGEGTFSLKNINLTIPDGKTMVILGPSGCGKTSLLRIIAGLESPDSGEVHVDGEDVTNLEAKDRKIGMVFQNYALYPHVKSEENILSYFMFRKKTPEMDQLAEEKYQRTSELMGVEIDHLIGKMPGNLSGGERQRVAIGRCITRDPVMFLLDEPFSSLDQKLREKYRISLKKLLKRFQITTVYVTHDQHEAVLLGDLISIMNHGEIVQVGTYQEIYTTPKNIATAEFLNLEYETRAINLCDGKEINPEYSGVIVGFRPEDLEITAESTGMVHGRVIDVVDLPLKKKSVLTIEVNHFDIQMYAEEGFKEGEEVALKINRIQFFDPESGERIDQS